MDKKEMEIFIAKSKLKDLEEFYKKADGNNQKLLIELLVNKNLYKEEMSELYQMNTDIVHKNFYKAMPNDLKIILEMHYRNLF